MATKRSGNNDDGEAAETRGGGTSRGAGSATRGGAAKKTATGTGRTKKTAGATAKKAVAAKHDASAGARKTAATGRSGSTGATGKKRSRPNLKADLRDFAAGRPEGWNHEDWMAFLEDLQARGHNIQDREAIGRALERERLDMILERAGGVGPKSRKALVERFETVWSLRNASADEIEQVAKVSPEIAQGVKDSVAG